MQESVVASHTETVDIASRRIEAQQGAPLGIRDTPEGPPDEFLDDPLGTCRAAGADGS